MARLKFEGRTTCQGHVGPLKVPSEEGEPLGDARFATGEGVQDTKMLRPKMRPKYLARLKFEGRTTCQGHVGPLKVPSEEGEPLGDARFATGEGVQDTKMLRPKMRPKYLARLKGLEPLTHCLEGSCSIHLSYRRVWSG